MRTSVLVFCFAAFFLLSCEKGLSVRAVVVRDCTGTYLRMAEKDYYVCNPDVLKGFNDGENVSARYQRSDGCDDGMIHCMMIHQSEGSIRVLTVER